MPLLPILLLLLLVLTDVYLWMSYARGVCSLWGGVLYWLPLAVLMWGIGCFVVGAGSHIVLKITFLVFLCVALPKIMFALFSLLGRLCALVVPNGEVMGLGCAVVVGSATFIMALYGFCWGWTRLVTKTETVSVAQLPAAFEGYKIVQISDLHLGTFGEDTKFVEQMVAQINELDADAVVFTGDLVSIAPEELEPFQAQLKKISARDGVFSILGNHDYCTYHPDKSIGGRKQRLQKLMSMQRAMGWRLLMNEHIVVRRGTDSLVIAGVENVARPPFPSHGDLPKALNGVREDACVVLLSHDPTHWRREVLAHHPNVRLTLSGHTHAMQFRLGNFTPSKWIYDEWGGHYEEQGQHLIVSTGAGSNIPFRFGAWPEIVVIELRGQEL